MTTLGFAAASLRYYWRTSLAAAAGVAVAVATLGGSLLVGTSVRASLRDLALARLGQVHSLVTADAPFTEALAGRVGGVPILALDGAVLHEPSGRRATGVQVYGVDDRFWQLQAVAGVEGPANRDAYLGPALAAELGAADGDALQLRVQKPSAIPAGVLQGRRDEPGRAVRVQVRRLLTPAESGDFSPAPRQGEARAIFIPLSRLQRDADLTGQANVVLLGAPDADAPPVEARLAQAVAPEDLGLRVRPLGGVVAIESTSGYLTDALADAARRAVEGRGSQVTPVLTYLATAIRANGRQTPYSLVSALPEPMMATSAMPAPATTRGANDAPLWLSAWAAEDLQARPGDAVTLDYFLWSDAGGLTSHEATFTLAGILPMAGLATDRDLTPDYPGLSTTEAMSDWDPPFPVDLTRVRGKDEDFWREHRTSPKAFVRIEDGQRLWRSRYGQLTSLRVGGLEAGAVRAALAGGLSASLGGVQVRPARADALAAAGGTTDFGEYFSYFSAFVVMASLLLTVLFFRLGVEQRTAEAGTLAAFGFTPSLVARLFLVEGAVLVAAGVVAGTAGAVGFTWLMLAALRTIWVGAVGTTALHLQVSVVPLAAGAAGGAIAGLACVAWTLRGFRHASVRSLMAGTGLIDTPGRSAGRATALGGWVAGVAALALVAAGAQKLLPLTAAFFGSGILLLVAGLCGAAGALRRLDRQFLGPGPRPFLRLGLRNAAARPSRALLSMALIGSASFLIVAVGAFRLGGADDRDPHGGTGGFSLMAESLQPLMHDPATADGRAALGLDEAAADLDIARFRLRPGDDASCANLYRPTMPRLLGATGQFIARNRFTFTGNLAATPEEQANPWRLLTRPSGDDRVVPVIGDATSLTYTFHVGVGDEIVIDAPDGRPLRLHVVGALRDSVLQSELIMSEAQFAQWFPREEGYRVFLVADPSSARTPGEIAAELEDRLSDFGFDARSAGERLAAFHRVENTYLSTFQALGGFGLILGTLGLGTVLLRNVLERRRELALLRATGFQRSHLVRTVVAESACLLGSGLALGLGCALVAIGPAYAERGEGLPIGATLALLAAVAVSGLLSTAAAARAVARGDLLDALTGE